MTSPFRRAHLAPLLLAAAAASPARAGTDALLLERIFADPPLDGGAPLSPLLSPSGNVLSFLKPNAAHSDVLDLWGLRLPSTEPVPLVRTADLLGHTEQKLTEQERMALERLRISQRGITRYAWCGTDSDALLFPLSGDLYLVRLGQGAPDVKRLATTDKADDAPALVPTCSPQGDQIAFVRNGNIFVVDTKTGVRRALTSEATETRTFGLAEFIAEEEMDRHEAMWWSPDGKTLLAFEVDEARVGVKVRAQIFADRTELVSQRYPAAGEANAVVRAHLIDVATGKRTLLQTPAADGYLPRAGFFNDGKPWVQWQSRDQRSLVLLEGDATGKLRTVLKETDAAWVDLHDDLHDLGDGRLLWSSERTGQRELYTVNRATGAFTQVTHEPEPVRELVGVNATTQQVFFAGGRDRGRTQHLFALDLASGRTTQVTTEADWHAATTNARATHLVDTRSSFGVPPRTVLTDLAGKDLAVVHDNTASPLPAFAAPTPQWLDLKARDGTVLNGLLLPPQGLKKGARAPVITFVYGGPTGQMVAKHWAKQYPLFVHWTQRGFGVFLVDNRGTGGRDRAFSRAFLHRFGDLEIEDVFAAVRAVSKSTPWIDAARIGLFGWSYGGFLTARALLDDNTPFAAGVAVAPVTDWTLYDTHYTERYLGMPVVGGKAQPAYADANLVTRAPLLKKPLLLAHGTADDNVLFEHTLRLVEALEKESLPFELMIYPGKAHGIGGRAFQTHVYGTTTRFFERTLRAP